MLKEEVIPAVWLFKCIRYNRAISTSVIVSFNPDNRTVHHIIITSEKTFRSLIINHLYG